MLAYFYKATYAQNNIYKLSDFFLSDAFVLNPNKKLDINIQASDGMTNYITSQLTLPDNTTIEEYTHIYLPSETKVYKILRIEYLNKTQSRVILEDDPLLAHYQTLKTKNILLSSSLENSLFLGTHSIKDLAVKHNATSEYQNAPAGTSGYWIVMTFQSDAGQIDFTFGDVDNVPLVGTNFTNLAAIISAYPEVNTNVPASIPYYLQFATTEDGKLYQCVANVVSSVQNVTWVEVKKSSTYTYTRYTGSSTVVAGNTLGNTKISNIGDVGTVNIALPLDCTLARQITYTRSGVLPGTQSGYLTVPSYYHLKSFTDSDKLLSIKLVPEELLNKTLTITIAPQSRITRIAHTLDGPPEQHYVDFNSTGTWFTKILSTEYLNYSSYDTNDYALFTLPVVEVKQYKTEFTFGTTVSSIYDYEPFKKYFLSFFGEVISIPARYASSFKARLAVTSTDVLYEIYTDRYNIIASGRLQWFTRYKVDQLQLFQANNPTYKEQFWTNQISSAIKNVGFGALGGATSKAGLGPGLISGATSSALSIATNALNLHWQEKGMTDKADQIYGQTDVSMSILKGFSAYIIIVTPETAAYNQMVTALAFTGFPVNTIYNINSLSNVSGAIFSYYKLVQGLLLDTVVNAHVTEDINKKLLTGVLFVV